MEDDLLKKIEKLLQPPKVKRKVRKYKGPLVVCDICLTAEAPIVKFGHILCRTLPQLNQLRYDPNKEPVQICEGCVQRYVRWRIQIRKYDSEKKRYKVVFQRRLPLKVRTLKKMLDKFITLKQRYGVHFDAKIELNKREWKLELKHRYRRKIRELVAWDAVSSLYEGYHKQQQPRLPRKKRDVVFPTLQEIREVLKGKREPTQPKVIEDEEEVLLQRLFKHFNWRLSDEEGTPSESSTPLDE